MALISQFYLLRKHQIFLSWTPASPLLGDPEPERLPDIDTGRSTKFLGDPGIKILTKNRCLLLLLLLLLIHVFKVFALNLVIF